MLEVGKGTIIVHNEELSGLAKLHINDVPFMKGFETVAIAYMRAHTDIVNSKNSDAAGKYDLMQQIQHIGSQIEKRDSEMVRVLKETLEAEKEKREEIEREHQRELELIARERDLDAKADREALLASIKSQLTETQALTLGESLKVPIHDAMEQQFRTYHDSMKLTINTGVDHLSRGVERNVEHSTALRSGMDEIKNAVLAEKNKTIGAKGDSFEIEIVEGLMDHYVNDDTVTIERCNTTARSCDAVVTAVGKPTIRLEMKNYAAGGRVSGRDVKTFVTSLKQKNDHGIMISSNARICGKSDVVHIDQLPTGKFAVYLSENKSPASIASIINLIYLLDEHYTQMEETDEDSTYRRISPLMIQTIQDLVVDCEKRISDAKAMLKSVASVLDGIHVNLKGVVETLLNKDDDDSSVHSGGTAPKEKPKFHCTACDKELASKYSLQTHKKTCKKIPSGNE